MKRVQTLHRKENNLLAKFIHLTPIKYEHWTEIILCTVPRHPRSSSPREQSFCPLHFKYSGIHLKTTKYFVFSFRLKSHLSPKLPNQSHNLTGRYTPTHFRPHTSLVLKNLPSIFAFEFSTSASYNYRREQDKNIIYFAKKSINQPITFTSIFYPLIFTYKIKWCKNSNHMMPFFGQIKLHNMASEPISN